MENPKVPAVEQAKQEDQRVEWVSPTITDYDIEEITLSHPPGPGNDAVAAYS